MKVLAGLLALVVAGCGYPADGAYVTESPPPAPTEEQNADPGADEPLVVTEGAATGFVFLVYDPATFSGTRPATEARSLDETVVRVLPATSTGTVRDGSPDYTGQIFVLVGVQAGTTEVEVSRHGDNTGRVVVDVVAQEK